MADRRAFGRAGPWRGRSFDGVDPIAAHRKPRPSAFDDRFADVFLTFGQVEPDDIDTRRYDRATDRVSQPHDAVDHVAFGDFEDACGSPSVTRVRTSSSVIVTCRALGSPRIRKTVSLERRSNQTAGAPTG